MTFLAHFLNTLNIVTVYRKDFFMISTLIRVYIILMMIDMRGCLIPKSTIFVNAESVVC